MRWKPYDLRRRTTVRAFVRLFLAPLLLSSSVFAQAPLTKIVGTVKSITASSVVLTTDGGTDTTVTFANSARIVRATSGQTDLKTAPTIQISDIQVGDRVAARGQTADDGALVASVAVVMKQGDIAQRQQTERDEWRKGVGGIVKEVNATAGTITIANSLLAGGKPVIVHVASGSEIRRYSPESVKFDDAKPGTLEQIKPGDQLRARGTKNADGTEFTAQAIVSGSFKDIAGTVVSTDAANNSITITDLATKKPVTVRVGPDSQLRKLPQFAAIGIAMRLKGGSAAGAQGGGSDAGGHEAGQKQGSRGNWRGADAGPSGNDSDTNSAGSRGGSSGGMGVRGQDGWRGNGGGPPDFQQMLARMPALSISELNKGDAIMLVATEGSTHSQPMAITLLSGVEPILSAAPAGTSAATILSPWNLGAPNGAGGEGSSQ
jgi:Domain of unknown function (DUF5666)